ncbi:PKD domain-containing protein [Pseudoalteromonas sp. SaAl2]
MAWKTLIPCVLAFTLTACGGSSDSSKDNTSPSKAALTNTKPTAIINTPTGEMRVNTKLIFSGESSSDPENDTLTYQWRLTSTDEKNEFAIAVNNQSKVEISVTEAQSYKLILIVSDGKLLSTPVDKLIEIKTAPTQLIASAGQPQTVKQGDVVLLNGALSSTSNGVITQYKWQFNTRPQSSNATIENNNSVKSQFIADKSGSYAVKLTITNSLGETASNEVLIQSEALDENSAPQAVIKVQNKTIAPNSIATLDGTQSNDPDQGDTLSYLWAITSQPANSNPTLTDNLTHTAGFSSSALGLYTLALTVKDQHGEANTASVTLAVEATNQAPIAQLVPERSIMLNDLVTLECAQCNDPEEQLLSYFWKLQGKPENSIAQLIQHTTATPSLSADIEGDYVITLIVSDGELNSEQAITVLSAQANEKPTAIISDVQPILVDEEIQLDGSQSADPEGESLTYEWEVVSPLGHATLSNTNVAKPLFKASMAGEFVVSLRTNDGAKYSDTQTITITVNRNAPPVLIFEGQQTRIAVVGNPVTFDVSQSYDPEGTALNYTWVLIKPDGSSAALTTTDQSTTQFTPDTAGIYSTNIVIEDTDGNSKSMLFITSATDTAMLTGAVKGQITNTQKVGIPNAKLLINGVEHTTDASGVFDTVTALEEGAKTTITTADERLANGEYKSVAITQNDFTLNLGQSSLPVMQDAEVSVFVCPEFTGPDTVNLRFKMIDTILTSSSFEFQFDETKPLVLPKSNGTYLDATLNIALPSSAIYEVTVTEDTVSNITGANTTIYYSQATPNLAIISICNI